MSQGSIHQISISPELGQKKTNVSSVRLDKEQGIIGDAHGTTRRQVSLLPIESFVKVAHPDLHVQPGDFAENITTQGLDFEQIRVGTCLKLGQSARLEVIQIGKQCHHGCIIRQTVGDCIMPREGVFTTVLAGGEIEVGDEIEIER
jgi:MOSC domain-containing protein YiiM